MDSNSFSWKQPLNALFPFPKESYYGKSQLIFIAAFCMSQFSAVLSLANSSQGIMLHSKWENWVFVLENNSGFQKTTTYIGLQAEQTSSVIN